MYLPLANNKMPSVLARSWEQRVDRVEERGRGREQRGSRCLASRLSSSLTKVSSNTFGCRIQRHNSSGLPEQFSSNRSLGHPSVCGQLRLLRFSFDPLSNFSHDAQTAASWTGAFEMVWKFYKMLPRRNEMLLDAWNINAVWIWNRKFRNFCNSKF